MPEPIKVLDESEEQERERLFEARQHLLSMFLWLNNHFLASTSRWTRDRVERMVMNSGYVQKVLDCGGNMQMIQDEINDFGRLIQPFDEGPSTVDTP